MAARAKPPSCVPQGRGVAPQARRCVAARAKPRGARTGARAIIRAYPRLRGRGRLLRERSRKGPSKTSGVDALFPLDQARRKPPLQGANRSAGASAADVRVRFDQARASARRSKARLAQSEHGRLEMGKCTTIAQTRINTGVFIVVQVYKNRRKRTRIERSVQEWGILVHPDNNGKPHKHWVFSILVHFWISSRGVYKNPVSVLLPGGEASLWRELWKTP